MSRIVYPANFIGQRTLLNNISTKHDADKTNSDIIPLLAQKNIDLLKDQQAATDAQLQEDTRLLLTKQSQNYCQLRDLQFDPVFSRFKTCVQYLKTFFKPNFKELGNWKIAIDNNGKISYPTDVKECIELFTAFKEVHDTFDKGTSPLQPFLKQNEIDLDADATTMASALLNHNKFTQAAKDAETATEKRDLLWNPAEQHLHEIGDYLKKLYLDNTKAMGLWGFVVDDNPKAPKERKSTLKIGQKVTITSVVIGGTLTNMGTGDIHVYKGKSTTGNPTIVHAGEAMGMVKGYSNITVSNPSTLINASFKVLTSQ
jgi:hypothetical protein